MMEPPFPSNQFDGFLRGEQQAEHIEVELLMEVLGGDAFEWRKLEDAGVVHENVEFAVGAFGFGEQALDVFEFRNVGMDGDGFSSFAVMRLTTASAPALLLA